MFLFKLKYKKFSGLYTSPKTDVSATSRLPDFVILLISSIFKFLTLSYPLPTRTLRTRPTAIIRLNEVTHGDLYFPFFLVMNKTKKTFHET